MGSPEKAPSPRRASALWSRLGKDRIGVAIALSKQGYYEWEEFRQSLMDEISNWESTHHLNDPEWDYYQCWLSALEKVLINSGVIQATELDAILAQLMECKSA